MGMRRHSCGEGRQRGKRQSGGEKHQSGLPHPLVCVLSLIALGNPGPECGERDTGPDEQESPDIHPVAFHFALARPAVGIHQPVQPGHQGGATGPPWRRLLGLQELALVHIPVIRSRRDEMFTPGMIGSVLRHAAS
jgi:hypothetical protein